MRRTGPQTSAGRKPLKTRGKLALFTGWPALYYDYEFKRVSHKTDGKTEPFFCQLLWAITKSPGRSGPPPQTPQRAVNACG
jgi:hypothetical protein